MENRVYGVIGIKAIRSNWNSDFTGRPRSDNNNTYISTDKAIKYAERFQWNNEGEKVFYLKSLNENLNPRSLRERYESLFGSMDNIKSSITVLQNLFSCVDIMNFGATFAEANNNISITGAVQISQGVNLYKDTEVETLQILSPFRNPNNKKDGSEKAMTTIGEVNVTNEAHYCFSFSVNPQNYNEFSYLDNFDGYKKEAYEKFKNTSRTCVTALNSCAKAGCDNEIALFVELKNKSKTYLPNLIDFISFIKNDDDEKNVYDLTKLIEFLSEFKNDINNIEIYYNNYITSVIIPENNCLSINKYNIFSGIKI